MNSQDAEVYHEAALARPDLPPTRAALGCVLGRVGRFAEALPHLREAVAANPFDAQAARALAQTLEELHDMAGRRHLEEERRRLVQAAPGVVRPEPWFLTRPANGALASLVLLCHNQVAYTRLCLESVLRHTRPPYELILVDNASTDETPAFLEKFKRHPGPTRVEVLHNSRNVGFPAGCNQGIAHARGDWVVFLNNDTIVTAGWLDGLLAHAVDGVDLVGPVTNASRPPQEIAVEDANIETIAERRRREYAGGRLSLHYGGPCACGGRTAGEPPATTRDGARLPVHDRQE